MIELTVKTLDSKNHSFSVPDDVTVKQFKEHIADTVNISIDSQRLIYCGRVLQDDKHLSEYDVNGKVVHLVQRAPPGANTSRGGDQGETRPNTVPRRAQQWRTLFGPGNNSGNAMYLGAMAFPAEIMDASGVSMQQPRPCLSQSRMNLVRSMLRRASAILNSLENPPQGNPDTPSENGTDPTETTPEEEEEVETNAELTSRSTIVISNSDAEDGSTSVMEVQPPEAVPTVGDAQPESASASNQLPNENENHEGGTNEAPRFLSTRVLADLMDQVSELNTRHQPYMSRYLQLMRDDPVLSDSAAVTANQRLFTSVSEVMHFLSHAYHALSDIMCDFSQPPPRNLRCRPVLIHHSAVVQAGIPIQVSGNLAGNTTGQQASNSGNVSSANSDNNTRMGAGGSTETNVTLETSIPSTVESQSPLTSESTSLWAAATTGSTEESPAQQPHSPAVTPPRATRIGSGGGGEDSAGFEFFVDVSPGSITIDSVEATVVTSSSPNTSEANQTWQNPPEFVQNLITALAGQFMGATLQQYRFPDQQNTGTNTQQTSPSTGSQQSSNSQARSNTATHPTTSTQTRSTARPHVHLSPSLQGIRTVSFDPLLPCNSHHIPLVARVGRPRATQARPTTTRAPEIARVLPIPTTSISISLGNGEPVINIEPQRSAATQQPALPQELQALLQSIRPNTAYSGQNPPTITQLLQSLPGYTYTPGESIFTDIFTTLAQSLSFIDMVQLGLGRSACLVRVRPHLRQLISQRLLNNNPLTIHTIMEFINRFNLELNPYYSILNNARLREDVDLPASINQYNHSFLPAIIQTIMEEDESTFHTTLIRKFVQYIRHLCAILQYCCLDGTTGLESIIRSFVNQATTGVPGALQDWTMSHSIVNFRNYVGSLQVPLEEFQSYLVYRASGAVSSPLIPPAAEPMETQDIENTVLESTQIRVREPPVTDIPPSQPHINEMIGWQNELPSEWVPVITRDLQRQRRRSPQRPFSDAYLSSMPPKRRKLISSAKPQGNLSQVISESMASALGAAGMSSGPEVDVIAQRAGQDSNLRAAYREQVRSTVCDNLTSNIDYVPDKYPNITKYFKKE